MSFTPQTVYAMLTTRGEEVTLRRLGTSPIDVTVLAKIDDAADQPLAGNMAQFQRRVTISDLEIAQTGWPGPPKRNDQIITSDGQVLSVATTDTTTIGLLTVMHRLTTLGA
jgi:hypothetical protein